MDIQKIIEELAAQPSIEYKELPAIGLYMDQVTTLLENHMFSEPSGKEGKRPTKTMINNYTKEGVLPPPDKKKYSREHLLLLILLWKLKPVMNMSNASAYISSLRENTRDLEGLKKFYEQFLTLEREMKTSFYAGIEERFTDMKEALGNNTEEKQLELMYALLLADRAAEEKRLAEMIIAQLKKDE